MYDIFDDIFDDGYGYNDYGMSDTDVDVELAFEAAMASSTDYDYDYATEGFRDAMGKIGNKIADTARNMVRKIGELFRKIASWIKDRFAPIRAKSAAKDNKTLAQVLKALDGQVERAAPNRKAEVKQKVARVKRAIMQYIDGQKREIDVINRCYSDMAGIVNALKPIGTSFIEKMNGAVMAGSEKDNTDDGNELIDKMNALQRRMADIVRTVRQAESDLENSDAMKVIEDDLPGGEDKLKAILFRVKFDKIDMRALFTAEDQVQVICHQGEDACERLEQKLNDHYKKWNQTTRSNEYVPYDDKTDKDKKFDDTSKEHLSALVGNWKKYADYVQSISNMLVETASTANYNYNQARQNKSDAAIGVRGGVQNKNTSFVNTYNTPSNRFDRAMTPSERGEV